MLFLPSPVALLRFVQLRWDRVEESPPENSPMSSPEDMAALWLKSFYAISSGAFVVIGIQMFMCLYGLIVFKETRPSQRNGRGIYIVISFLILVFYTFSATGDGYQIFELLFKSTSAVDAQKRRRIDDHEWWSIACTLCSMFVNWIGDGILVYRCYVIFQQSLWIIVLPSLAYLSSIGTSIYVIVGIILSTTNIQSTRYNPRALSAWMFLSVALNCMVTILVLYKLIRIRLEIKTILPFCDPKATRGVVAILVESALPLAISGIAAATVVSNDSPTGLILDAIFYFSWMAFNALSPQLIIFRVTMGRSWSHKGPHVVSDTLNAIQESFDITFTREHPRLSNRETNGLTVVSL
ncbi:hypothetical protein CPB83DRAFT_909338 [Crepidotus variabilis]|uniref:Uncharacterized protein n=1 Tax=Crepidotus variabilis TaxID=179855 RepID=A0A9P6EA18_9AGAR|nr:hypothetical protein CPB83DRAFT_909338 [Crepidotus variabilis]